jgi:hypothetical protein
MAEEQKTISAIEYVRNIKDQIDLAFVNIRAIVGTLTEANEKLTKENAELKSLTKVEFPKAA